jgi:hypothetical protein
MHKKLAADLISLAHSILQMKNKDDVFALKDKAHEVYEKLSVLAYVEEYINNTPNADHTKEELVALIENASENDEKEVVLAVTNDVSEEDFSNTENQEELSQEAQEDPSEVPLELIEKEPENVDLSLNEEEDLFSQSEETSIENPPTLEEELKDTMAVDVVADLFENATKKSLNDKLQPDIQIGLNDRIAFVKNLFDGSQEDFNRVVSQLNSFKTEKEVKKFINKVVKPDYDWSDKEDVVARFMSIVERKFN